MSLEWFAFHLLPINTALSLPGILIVLLFAVTTILLFVRSLSSLQEALSSRLPLFIILMLLAVVLAQALIVQMPTPFAESMCSIPTALLGLLPMLIAAFTLGIAPAMLISGLTGLAWTVFTTGRITQPFELAITAAALSWLLRQPYHGSIPQSLRQPLVAMPLIAILIAWPLSLLGLIAGSASSVLIGLDHAFSAFWPSLLIWLVCSLAAGLIAQAILLLRPAWHPVQPDMLIAPPWEQHLNQRVLFTLVPMIALSIVALVSLLSVTAYQVATRLVVNQMGRDASNAAENIPFFIQVGRSLIRNLAEDPALLDSEGGVAETYLSQGLRAVPFFQQLAYFDASGKLTAVYPSEQLVEGTLSDQEQARVQTALDQGAPAEVVLAPEATGSEVVMSFITPIMEPGNDKVVGVLVGRTTLSDNPILAPVVDILRSGLAGSGVGFIIDDQNRILLYPADPDRQQEIFTLTPTSEIALTDQEGSAFRQREPDGTRDLIYLLPVSGRSDWTVAVSIPNEVVLALAAQIALPMLVLLLVLTAVALPLIILVMRHITGNLNQLLTAVDAIREGNLTRAINVTGQDELGRLGQTFEQMRVSLKARLDEQERLLRVSRSVSSSLELFRAMPPILSSALEVSNAIGVRIVVRQNVDEPPQSYAAGEAAAVIAPLDMQLLELVEHQGTVVISQLWRVANSLDITALPPRIQALVALPLRSDTSFHGIFWLAYDHEHVFDESELTFLSTMASQAAVAIANAKLFAEAEEERRKLEAVLESTADAMIVVDQNGRIQLLNPAAEQYFGIRADQVRGKRVEDVIDIPDLAHLLSDLQEPITALEIPGQRSRTLLASISTMLNEGTITGRVAVMRDITALKELDNIKTVFLRMVSHDLRSPLTYMRGFLSMLPLTGELNERQHDAIQKVTNGIDSISDLTDRLLYLSRLQFGEEANLEVSLIDLETLLSEVITQQEPFAADRNVEIRVELPDRLPLVAADPLLYRQAITNLVTNALKYSPEGGEVIIRATHNGDSSDAHITVAVEDKGIGIREEDQARLFEAFFRVPQREGEPARPRGTGLGLALVKAIALAHGGIVGVHSEFGNGSTFHITVPVRRPDDF